MYVHLVTDVFDLPFSHPDGYCQIMLKLGEYLLMAEITLTNKLN